MKKSIILNNTLNAVVGAGLFAVNIILNPGQALSEVMKEFVGVWTEFFGDGIQGWTGDIIDDIAEKINENEAYKKSAEAYKYSYFFTEEGRTVCDKILLDISDSDGKNTDPRKLKKKKGQAVADLAVETLFNDLKDYLNGNSDNFRNLDNRKQNEFVKIISLSKKLYLKASFNKAEKSDQLLACVIVNSLTSYFDRKFDNGDDISLKGSEGSAASPSTRDIAISKMVEARPMAFVRHVCPNCGYSGERLHLFTKERKTRIYCAACDSSYSAEKENNENIKGVASLINVKIEDVKGQIIKSTEEIKGEIRALKEQIVDLTKAINDIALKKGGISSESKSQSIDNITIEYRIVRKEVNGYINNYGREYCGELAAAENTLVNTYKKVEGFTIRASSIYNSCKKPDSEEPEKDYLDSVKKFAEEAKTQFPIFISAITERKGESKNTLDYRVAIKLTDAFKDKEVNYFWWEDAKEKEIIFGKDKKKLADEWQISTKVAVGLEFASLFVGLAFDTVTAVKDKYVFNCLLDENNDAVYKNPNFYKYEVDTFASFIGENGKNKAAEFAKDIVDENKLKALLPQYRDLKIFSYGGAYKPEGYPVFNNNENRLVKIKRPEGDENVLDLAQQVYDEIVDTIAKSSSLRKLLFGGKGKITPSPARVRKRLAYTFRDNVSEETEELFKPYVVKGETKLSRSEDVAMNPAEFFFEYAVVDDEGKNAKDRVTIFPRRAVTDEGRTSWSMCAVIKDWNYAFIEDKKLLEEATSDAVEVGSSSYNDVANTIKSYPLVNYTKVKFIVDRDKNDKENDNGINYKTYTQSGGFLTIWSYHREFGNIKGQFIFSGRRKDMSGQAEATTEKLTCSITFMPKNIVRYSVHQKKRRDDISKGDFTFKLDQKPFYGGIACGLSDLADQNRPVKESQNDFHSRKNTWRELTLSKYSLRPSDKSGRYNLFLCEGRYQRPDQRDKKASGSDLPMKKRQRCPYCGRYLFPEGKGEREGNDKCFGYEQKLDHYGWCKWNNVYRYVNVDDNGTVTVNDSADDSNLSDGGELLKMKLPERFDKGAVVQLMGVSGAGKSTFISALFNVKDSGGNFNFNGSIARALNVYADRVSFYSPLAKIDGAQGNRFYTSDGISKRVLEDSYKFKLYEQFIDRTPTKKPVLANIPYMIEFKGVQNKPQNAYLSFFDIAGGDAYDPKRGDLRFIQNANDYVVSRADCIVLLVNGTPDDKIVDRKGDKPDFIAAEDILKTILNTYKGRIDDMAVAVVLCKFDEFADQFDVNSHVRMSPPESVGNKFGGSVLQKYIDCCSEEVEDYLSQNGGSEFVKTVNEFSHRKYFVVSAVGRRDAIIPVQKTVADVEKGSADTFADKPVFNANPYNIENVLLWIMYKTGIIE